MSAVSPCARSRLFSILTNISVAICFCASDAAATFEASAVLEVIFDTTIVALGDRKDAAHLVPVLEGSGPLR